MAEAHEVPLAKKTAMQAAGLVLGSPKLYRRAIATADSALEHLPRFATYSRLNAWGKGRENPQPPRQSFPSVVGEKPRGAQSGASPRHEQPRRDPRRRCAPTSRRRVRCRTYPSSTPKAATCSRASSRRSRRWAALSWKAHLTTPWRKCAKKSRARAWWCPACRRSPAPATSISTRRRASLADVEIAIVRAAFGVPKTGSIALTEAELGVNTLGLSRPASRRAARPRRPS